jgi:hypothetical protein
VQEWRGLKVPGHVEEVLKAVKSILKKPPELRCKSGPSPVALLAHA